MVCLMLNRYGLMSTKHQSHQALLHYWSSLDWGAVCLNGFDSVTEPHSVAYYGHGRQLLRMWRDFEFVQ